MGTVYLVGAGPGDPGLLTIRAAELLGLADVVVHDALINPAILAHARPDAEIVFVGKRGGARSPRQDEINSLLVELAGRHQSIVRLKGGDPFVFGRGGEEAEALSAAHVNFEVVPGITAGIAAPAYAGIPMTHRGLSSSVLFATGHEDPVKGHDDLDWNRLAGEPGTLVFYMGMRQLDENVRRLVRAGRSPDTPAAVVEWATYPRQRTVVSTLAHLASEARAMDIGSPALVVIGEVVRVRERLAWFERRPLFGRKIVVTRARTQAGTLAHALEDQGAEVIEFPTIRITDPEDPEPLREAAKRVGEFDWAVFTSANAVERFWRALREADLDTRALGGVSLCAIGPATAAALEREGARADVIPAKYVGEAVAAALENAAGLNGARILLPRAELGRPILPELLRARGAEVVEVVAYRTVPDGSEVENLRGAIRRREVDVLTFTSSSTARNFVDLFGTDVGRAKVASIGPITSQTARQHGLRVDIEAARYTVPGLIEAVVAHFAGETEAG